MSDKLVVVKESLEELGRGSDSDLVKEILNSGKDERLEEPPGRRNYYTPQAKKTIQPTAKTHSEEIIYKNHYLI